MDIDTTKEILENKFMNSFGMTIDQFERLDFETQEELIKKVARIQYKINKETKGFKLKDLFTHYPIFVKTLGKKNR